jgi:hypothetical protein
MCQSCRASFVLGLKSRRGERVRLTRLKERYDQVLTPAEVGRRGDYGVGQAF